MPDFLLLMKSELMITMIIFILLIIKLGKGIRNEQLLTLVQILLLINTAVAAFIPEPGKLFGEMFHSNSLICLQKTMVSLALYLVSLAFSGWFRKTEYLTEFFVLMMSSVLGMYFLLSSGNLLMLFLSLELSTLPIAALANFELEKKKSAEAAMKMILSSAFSSGIMLFGISLFYGATGTLDFSRLVGALQMNNLQLMALVFLISAFAFKLSVVPFHLWTADVYQGSPTPVTAFLSVISKATMAFVMAALLFKVLAVFEPAWHWLLIVLSLATMLIGNLFAIRQTNIKRFLAFSSIAQVGFILAGMTGTAISGTASVSFFILVYIFSNLAAFVVAGILADQFQVEDLEGFRGLRKKNPFLAWMMALAVFSLAGIPPAAGFFGKIFLLGSGAYSGHVWFILLAALNMVVSLYYYLKIIRLMFMEDVVGEGAVYSVSRSEKFTLVICAVGIVFTGVFSWIYDYIYRISS